MLEGVTVLSAEVYLAGPYGSRLLQDLGADVIKIENTDGGDTYRYMNHEYDVEGTDDFTYRFLQYNRGKESVSLNLKDERGAKIFKELAKDADVVMENLRPGSMKRFGLGYDDIKAVNEEIIYCSISGFGATGPYRDRAAVDTIIQAMSGLVAQNAADAGEPALTGIYIADMVGGMYAAMSVLSALASKTHRGTYIDVSMMDSLVSMLGHEAAEYSARGTAEPRIKSTLVPQGVYGTGDGAIAINILDADWPAFCEILGLEAWIDSERFGDPMSRQRNEAALDERLEEVFSTESTAYWADQLLDAGIMAAPVQTVEEVFEDEQVTYRELLRKGHNEDIGDYVEIDFPAKFSNFETTSEGSHRLGEDTVARLEQLGYSPEEIEELRDRGVIKSQ